IVNLVVNARDAMPHGGSLAVETANATLVDLPADLQPAAEEGNYVQLAICDSGTGMADDVREHIFEPFFTTKELGRGTGLGLSTVYGIVKQNGGHIWVHSQVGQGTTFKIYLPRTHQVLPARLLPARQVAPAPAPASVTVLVVEDEPAVRKLAVRILQQQGYRVLDAADGLEALQVSSEHQGPIDLLLTDVVMPRLNGKELADQLQVLRPETRVLFMSGYSDHILTRYQARDDIAFLAKPFTLETLVARVGAILAER
ncbi:MAG: response regulator, partial [Chloroflexi bacterium]|nr:response regulator [Chloroflexota bacterium]